MPTPVADPAAIAAVQDILKEVWPTDRLQSQMLEETIVLDYCEDVTEYTDSDGLRASVPLRTARTSGISARGINQKLGPAGHQTSAKASYNYVFNYLTIKVLGPVVARMKTDRQAAVREVDFEVENGLNDFKLDLQRQLHLDGTGNICQAAATVTGTATVSLANARGQHAIRSGWLYVNMWVDIGTKTNPTAVVQGAKIIDVDDVAYTITLDTNITLAAADIAGGANNVWIGRYGNRSAGVSYEMNGLEAIISQALPLGGIDPTVAGNKYWKAVIKANGGTLRTNSIDLMLQVEQGIRQAGGKSELLLADLTQERLYYNILQKNVRFITESGTQGKLESGNVRGLEMNNKPLVGDPMCPPSKVEFVNKKDLMMFSAGKTQWQNTTTGGDILAWVQDEDSFVARAAKYANLGTQHRRGLGRLGDLAES